MKKIIKFIDDISDEAMNFEVTKIENMNGIVTHISSLLPIIVVQSDNLKYIDELSNIDIIEDNTTGTLEHYDIFPQLDMNSSDYNLFQQFDDIKVAIIDSLITDNKFNVADKVDFTEKGLDNTDVIHADIVADIIYQIAPGVTIYNAKIAHDQTFKKEHLIKALEWAYKNKVNIINLSLGTKQLLCNGHCIICQFIAKLREHNILSVAAAGNEGPGEGTITCPGNSEAAITVGAIDIKKKVADFSSRGDYGQAKPDLVTSSYVKRKNGKHKSGEMKSGTSFAAPIITGACARIFKNRDISDVERIIYNSVQSVKGSYQDYGRGIFLFKKMKSILEEEKHYETEVDCKYIR